MTSPLEHCQMVVRNLTETLVSLRNESNRLKDEYLQALDLERNNHVLLLKAEKDERLKLLTQKEEEIKLLNDKLKLIEAERDDMIVFIDIKLQQFGKIYTDFMNYSKEKKSRIPAGPRQSQQLSQVSRASQAPLALQSSQAPLATQASQASQRAIQTPVDAAFQAKFDTISKAFSRKALKVTEKCNIIRNKGCTDIYNQYKANCQVGSCKTTQLKSVNEALKTKLGKCIEGRLNYAEQCGKDCIDLGHAEFIENTYGAFTKCSGIIDKQ